MRVFTRIEGYTEIVHKLKSLNTLVADGRRATSAVFGAAHEVGAAFVAN